VKAIQITEFGGPEVLELVDLPKPAPGAGEALVRISRVGVNFADTHATRNDYLAIVPNGAYAEYICVPEASLVHVPDEVDDDQAAGLLIQGLTADAILRISANMQPGESVAVNAAAGGTGSLALQVARSMGAGRVIAMASSPEKRDLTLDLGADVAVDSRSGSLKEDLIEANGGEMLDVVLEMAGGEAFEQCLSALAPFGRLVTFGIASSEENRVRTGSLMRHSRAVIGFWITHLLARQDLVRPGLERVLGAAAEGRLKTVLGGTHPLEEAAGVHRAMAARRTIGKILLDPSQ
jgi:NADPH2:quinone reductase